MALQGALDKDRKHKRKWLESNANVIKEIFGKESAQYKECEENILSHDSQRLRDETDKYVRHLKITKKFCKVGRNASAVMI